MAWVKYTEPLPSGQSITHDQMVELWEAYRERLDGTLTGNYTAQNWTNFGNSGLVSDLTGSISGVGATAERIILRQLRAISTRYLISETGPTAWALGLGARSYTEISSGNVFWKAAEDLGFTEIQFADLFANNAAVDFLDVAEKWNIMWRAIQKMQWAAVPINGLTGYDNFKKSESDANWATAKSKFLSEVEGEIVISPFFAQMETTLQLSTHFITGRRGVYRDSVTIPATSIFSAYDLRIFFNTTSINDYGGPLDFIWEADTVRGDTPSAASTAFFLEKTAVTQSGTITPSFQFAGYSNSTELDHWERLSAGSYISRVAPATGAGQIYSIFLKPAFSYGEDPP